MSKNKTYHKRNPLADDLFAKTGSSTAIQDVLALETQSPTSNLRSLTNFALLNREQDSIYAVSLLGKIGMPVEKSSTDDDWSLNSDQILFMLERKNFIAYALSDQASDEKLNEVRALAESSEYLDLFGEMGFDEAWDRFLSSLEEGSGNS